MVADQEKLHKVGAATKYEAIRKTGTNFPTPVLKRLQAQAVRKVSFLKHGLELSHGVFDSGLSLQIKRPECTAKPRCPEISHYEDLRSFSNASIEPNVFPPGSFRNASSLRSSSSV